MKKVFLSLLALSAIGFNAVGQTAASTKLSIGTDLAVPTGNFAILSGIGYGGSAKAEFNMGSSVWLTGSAGYLNFPYKKVWTDLEQEYEIDMGSMSGIPLKVGAKYYFSDLIYGSAELGAAFTSGATALIYVPSVGLSVPLGKQALDVDARYESWSNGGTTSFLGIRAAYSFGL